MVSRGEGRDIQRWRGKQLGKVTPDKHSRRHGGPNAPDKSSETHYPPTQKQTGGGEVKSALSEVVGMFFIIKRGKGKWRQKGTSASKDRGGLSGYLQNTRGRDFRTT